MLQTSLFNAMSSRSQTYEARLHELQWSRYQLAQEVVAIRQRRGEEVTFKAIESAVRRAFSNPETASAQMNDDIIEALGGETIIRWKTSREVRL